MRTVLWLSIIVFISTLFWPQLLDERMLVISSGLTFILILIPYLRILAVIPIAVIYFTLYANLTLTGRILPTVALFNQPVLQQSIDDQDHNIVVQIKSLISDRNGGYFSAKLIELDGYHLNYSPYIEMRWYKPTVQLQAGQKHQFLVRFKPVYGRANPAGFDRQKWSYSEHVAYQAKIIKHLAILDESVGFRASFYQKVKKTTEKFNHQGLMLALSFADKSLIPLEQKQQIKQLGISHLFAISGLHIGLLFGFAFMLVKRLTNHYLAKNKMGWFSFRLINISALFSAFMYAYLAGFSLPTQRAFLMLLIAVVIFSLKRKCAKTDLLLLTLFLVLLWDPLAVLSLSLWLSFTAVTIILLLLWAFPSLSKLTDSGEGAGKWRPFKKYMRLLILLQIGLTVLMLPLQLSSFAGVSLLAPVINLIAVPLFSVLIIPLVLSAALATLFYPPMAVVAFSLADKIIALFFDSTAFALNSYYLFSKQQQLLVIVLFSVILIATIIYLQRPNNKKIVILFSLFLASLIVFQQYVKTPSKSWFVETIDVGQGLAVLLRSGDKALLYDTGARYPSGFNMAEHEIIPYLISLGIKKLDYLVISHSDIDHAGGADIINGYFPVTQRWAGEPLNSYYPFQLCVAGDSWQFDKLSVQVLAPFEQTSNNNNNSCVLRISDGVTAVLLTGDIEKKQEKILYEGIAKQLAAQILFAPHHGSRHSSSEDFIRAVNPQWVVFSAGFMNHWGFPQQEVIERYEKQSVRMVNSGLSGLIRFEIGAQGINMKTFREDLAPYWYHHSITLKQDWK